MPSGRILSAAGVIGLLALLPVYLWLTAIERPSTLILTGLKSPRGLTALDGEQLLISEVLGGRLLRTDLKGKVTEVAAGLPATFGGPSGDYPIGVSSAILHDQAYYYVAGEPHHGGGVSRIKDFSTLYRLRPGGEPERVAGGIGPFGFSITRITNPYDLAAAPRGGFFISDAGVNAVLYVSDAGEISDYAVFPKRDIPGPAGPITIEAVPTGIALGPDKALYVATFTGHPYPRGEARVYRFVDVNDDGDAMDQGEVAVFAQGFSVATDLVFDENGGLLVTEFSADMLRLVQELGHKRAAEIPGRVVRWDNGVISVVAEGLVSPTSVAIVDGRILVSEEFIGSVTEVNPKRFSTRFAAVVSAAAGVGVALVLLVGAYAVRLVRSEDSVNLNS